MGEADIDPLAKQVQLLVFDRAIVAQDREPSQSQSSLKPINHARHEPEPFWI
jgi:hypothetical protein